MFGAVTKISTPAGDPAWLVTGYEEVKALFTDPRLGLSHPDPEHAARLVADSPLIRPAAATATEQADHARMRRLLGKAFSARRLAALRPHVEALVERHLLAVRAMTPPVDFHRAFSFPLPALVICQLLGVPAEDRDDFHGWCEDMARVGDPARARTGMRLLQGYLTELVAAKRAHPGTDVISDLVAAVERGELTDGEIRGYATILLFAGHVTTATAIDKGIVLLEHNPEQRQALWADPALVPRAVEEILRAALPAGTNADRPQGGRPRYARTDIELGGVTLAAGDLVLLGGLAANLDERVFPKPCSFDVRRATNPHLSFGHGPHFCLGAPLARIELQAVFTLLPRYLPGLRLAVGVEDLRRREDLVHMTLTELPVTW
jgi:pentalenolactone synthase